VIYSNKLSISKTMNVSVDELVVWYG